MELSYRDKWITAQADNPYLLHFYNGTSFKLYQYDSPTFNGKYSISGSKITLKWENGDTEKLEIEADTIVRLCPNGVKEIFIKKTDNEMWFSKYFWYNDFKPELKITIPENGNKIDTCIKNLISMSDVPTNRAVVQTPHVSKILNATVYYLNQAKKKTLITEIKKYCDSNNIQMNIDDNMQFIEIFLADNKFIFVGILPKDNVSWKRCTTAQKFHSNIYEYQANKNKYSDYDDYNSKFFHKVHSELMEYLLDNCYDSKKKEWID